MRQRNARENRHREDGWPFDTTRKQIQKLERDVNKNIKNLKVKKIVLPCGFRFEDAPWIP